jgi:hypothetical protein
MELERQSNAATGVAAGHQAFQMFPCRSVSGFLVGVLGSVFSYFRDKKHQEEIRDQERRFEAFKKELEDKQRRLVRFENVQELMKQYKKVRSCYIGRCCGR